MSDSTRYGWARLNADGLFVASLALVVGLFDFVEPDYADLEAALGHIPFTYWLWSGMFFSGGLLMFIGLIRQQIGLELLGRVVIFLAACLEMVRTFTVFGFRPVMADIAVVVILALFFGLRAHALLTKSMVVVVGTSVPDPEELL